MGLQPVTALTAIDVPLWGKCVRPSMRIVLPADDSGAPRPAILVLQGGAYATSSGSGGGSAEWIAQQGMVGGRVDYRTRSAGGAYPVSYSDAARAVRLVRHRAAEWNIDPSRIGVLGYSAGGHLASLLSTRPTLFADPDDDLLQRYSARPNLVVLAYPLISFVDGYSPGAYAGSVENFLGRPSADESLRREFSNELFVDRTHPPVFIWTTWDDTLVPFTHSQLFVNACRREGVAVTFELYPHGPHGMGLALGRGGAVGDWTKTLLRWIAEQWGQKQ